jgi:hypothetical protein
MAYFIGHITALRYYRALLGTPGKERARALPRPNFVPNAAELISKAKSSNNPALIDALSHSPIDLICADRASRSKSLLANSHVWTLPEGTGFFIKVAKDIYIASPEFCFLQLSRNCDAVQLLKIGFELCGIYSLDSASDYGFRNRKPLTNVAAIKRLATKIPNARIGTARKILEFLRDGSASPMETCLALTFGLPARYGGYGLGVPEMNKEIAISERETPNISHNNYHCDLYWDGPRVAVEYNSRSFHFEEYSIEQDASRINNLQVVGVQVIALTRLHARSPQKLDTAAHSLAKLMGKRIRSSYTDTEQRHSNLRKQLFAKDKWC